jgi:hypothetical protein
MRRLSGTVDHDTRERPGEPVASPIQGFVDARDVEGEA